MAPPQTSVAPRPAAATQNRRVAAPAPDIRWPRRLQMRSRCTGRTGNSAHQATLELFRYTTNFPCFAKLAACGQIILKERLTSAPEPPPRPGSRACEIVRKFGDAWHIQGVIRGLGGPTPRCFVHDILFVRPADRTRFLQSSSQPHDPDH